MCNNPGVRIRIFRNADSLCHRREVQGPYEKAAALADEAPVGLIALKMCCTGRAGQLICHMRTSSAQAFHASGKRCQVLYAIRTVVTGLAFDKRCQLNDEAYHVRGWQMT